MTFWRLIFQERLAWFTLNLVCVLSQYAGTCTANLVLFGPETTELRTHVKLYFVLHVNMLTLCTHAPFSWAAQHTTMCLDHVIGLSPENIHCSFYPFFSPSRTYYSPPTHWFVVPYCSYSNMWLTCASQLLLLSPPSPRGCVMMKSQLAWQ